MALLDIDRRSRSVPARPVLGGAGPSVGGLPDRCEGDATTAGGGIVPFHRKD